MEWLQPRFPDGAQPHAAIFFALVAFVMLAILIANRRSAIKAARWPIVRGRIVRSSVDSYKARVGGVQMTYLPVDTAQITRDRASPITPAESGRAAGARGPTNTQTGR